MSRDANRVQRYKLVAEFALRDRGDYEHYRRHLHDFFVSLDQDPGFQSDYLSIEKVIEADPNGTRKQ